MIFEPGRRVHVVGVGGAGMSGLARLLSERGCVVTGSDDRPSPALEELAAAGVDVRVGRDPRHGERAEVVLWSPAVAASHVELSAARERGAELVPRARAMAELGHLQPVIGLTGTHGKTTATSMMVHVLGAAGRDDSRLVGAPVIGVGPNGHWGGPQLVLEVDESYGTFALLEPYALGLLNVEPDHLDHYGSLDALEAAFAALVARTTGPVVAWGDDPGASRVGAAAGRDVQWVGRDARQGWRVQRVELSRRTSRFVLDGPATSLAVDLDVPGAHNVANAAVVAVLALALGVAGEDVVRGLGAFRGAPRRFQLLGRWRGADVYADYAHLPGEIAATLDAAREGGYRRVTAVFQPHRVTRTVALAGSFAGAFAAASRVVVTDIYDAGEANPDGVTGEVVRYELVALRGERGVTYASDLVAVAALLGEWDDPGDVIILLGAGDVADVASHLSGGLG